MESKKRKSGYNKKIIIIICVIVAVIVTTSCVFIQLQAPYAISVAGKELVFVEDEQTGQAVIKDLIDEYKPENSRISSILLDKKFTLEKVKLWEKHDVHEVLSEQEAVESLKAENRTGKNMITATITGETEKEEDYTPKTVYKKDETMFAGESRVDTEAKKGKQLVTREITTVNGEVTNTEIVHTEILDKGVAKVVYKGVRGLPEGEDWKTYEGEPIFVDGQDMVDYSRRYLGAPYKYGGSSFKTGIDCVQFVAAMYKKYGITLPKSHSGLQHSGKGVSYANAKAGDIICYNGHVALYMGNGKIIHATPKGGVKIGNAQYRKIVAVRRIVK